MPTVSDGYAELLARQPWHWFATLTFSPTKEITDCGRRREVERFHPLRGMHQEAADKCFRWFVAMVNLKVYGKHWERKRHGGVVWSRGTELHQSGRLHYHAVLAGVDCDLNKVASRYHWHEFWFREFGRNQLERPSSQDDVVGYVSKYVAKDGVVDVSRNFEAGYRPLNLFRVGSEAMAMDRRVKP